jgi:basic membrane protein A
MDKTFVDPEWGAATADSMIDKGVDVVFGAGGKTGNGAVEEGAKRGVYVIGVDTDQYYALPSAKAKILSSAYKLITPGVHDLIKLAKDGKFPGGDDYLGPAGFAPYHDLDSAVPADVKSTMDTLFKALQDGTMKTNVPPAKP